LYQLFVRIKEGIINIKNNNIAVILGIIFIISSPFVIFSLEREGEKHLYVRKRTEF